jgi:hypothetical protein
VFDIDMTDYDEIRTCCSDKAMCKRCWGYIAAATEVLDSALRGSFLFSPHFLPFLAHVKLYAHLMCMGLVVDGIQIISDISTSFGSTLVDEGSIVGFRIRPLST